MKKLFKFAILATAAVLVTANLSSCSKDDDENDQPNYVKIGDTTYELGSAQCFYWTSDGLTGSDMYFYAPGITFDMTSGYYIAGDGITVNLYYLYSDSDGRMPKSGTYRYSSTPVDLTHSGGSDYELNANNDPSNWIQFGENTTITVKNLGNDKFDVTWSGGTDKNGQAVSGHYKGRLYFFRVLT